VPPNIEYFQKRAEEARTLAEQMLDAHTKTLMLGIAESYEKIAESYEKIANWEKRPRQ
jgi:pyruvate dehydrogenase complex dehydrogenase (E1) component